ncbi:MAG: DeoR family transcriptional regulator [Candidatus Latescibacteria bacterium]|nr:DeoR family transcriptional regulator [Candidatus Latescibacterota bacterium]
MVKSRDRVDLRELRLNKRQIEALRLMVNDGAKITIRGYREKFGISEKTAQRDLRATVNLGLVVKRGVKKGAYFEAG